MEHKGNEQARSLPAQFFHEARRRTFELMYGVFDSYPENNFVNWFLVAVATVQITFYPLRRAVPIFLR